MERRPESFRRVGFQRPVSQERDLQVTEPRLIQDFELPDYRQAAMNLEGFRIGLKRLGGGGSVIVSDDLRVKLKEGESVLVIRALPGHIVALDNEVLRIREERLKPQQ